MCRPDDRDLGLLPQVRAVRVRWLRGGTGASRRPVLPLHLPRRGLRARLGLVAAGVRQLVRMAPRGDGGGRAGVQQRAPRDLLRRGHRPSRGAVMTRDQLAEWCVNVTEKREALQHGTRAQPRGPPDMFGTVVRLEPHLYATDPIHVDVLVRWDD